MSFLEPRAWHGQQPGRPKPPGNPRRAPDPDRPPPMEEPPDPVQPPPPERDDPPPVQATRDAQHRRERAPAPGEREGAFA